MIRSLNKPLLKEWTIAQALKPISNHSRSFSRCRRSVLIVSSPPFSRNSPYTYLSIARIANARYSTLPDETNVKTKDVPPPSTSIPSRKLKVDLRPAPKTLKEQTRGTTQPPRPVKPTIHGDNSASSSAPSHTPTTSTTSPPEGLLQTTQSDILDATKKGILSPPPEDVSKMGRLWHNLKQLFYFYVRGIKLIFVTHRKQASAIRRRVQEAQARGEEASMTRLETRFVQTYRMDLVKLLPFLVTVIVLEEALPFVVLYLPGLLPSTCLLPSQRERIEAKRREKQAAHVAIAKIELERLKNQHQYNALSVKENGLTSLSGELTRAVSGILARSTWGPVLLQRHRIAKYLTYLSVDDALLVKEGMGSRLQSEELLEALEERGFIVDPTTPQHMLQMLQWWLKGASDDKARIDLVLQAASNSSK